MATAIPTEEAAPIAAPTVTVPSDLYEGECKVGDEMSLKGKVTEVTPEGAIVEITEAEMETPAEDATETDEGAGEGMPAAMKAAVGA